MPCNYNGVIIINNKNIYIMALKKHCFKMTGTGLYKLGKAKNGVKPAFSHYSLHDELMTHSPSQGKHSDKMHRHPEGKPTTVLGSKPKSQTI